MSYVFRPFDPADEPTLARLWTEAWAALFPAIDFAARWPKMLALWRGMADAGAAFEVAATASSPAPLGFIVVAHGRLEQILAASGVQGAGLGPVLLTRAKALSPLGLGLDVNVDNARALRFYEREGFRVTGRGSNPMSGLPIYTMAWRGTAADWPPSPTSVN